MDSLQKQSISGAFAGEAEVKDGYAQRQNEKKKWQQDQSKHLPSGLFLDEGDTIVYVLLEHLRDAFQKPKEQNGHLQCKRCSGGC